MAVLVAAATLVGVTACDDVPAQDPTTQPTTQPTTADDQGEQTTSSGALYFYPAVEGAQVTYSNVDDGVESVVTVRDVEENASGTVVRTEQTISGLESFRAEATYTTASDGSLVMSLAEFFAGMDSVVADASITTAGDDLVIPSIEDMESGATTEDNATVTISGQGQSVVNDVTFTVSGAGYETITTGLGTFDTYVVDVAMAMRLSIGRDADATIRYWLVPGFGWIRQQNVIEGQTTTLEVTDSTARP